MPTRWMPIVTIGIVLITVTVATYWPVLSCDYVNVDDASYVYLNSAVKQGLSLEGLKYAATAVVCANWHPLTLLSLQLDSTVWGANAAGYHTTNLIFHTVNVVLLFAALYQLTQRAVLACCVAALFGLHPLHVESVAWISERKDVLSAFFLLLTLLLHVNFVRRPTVLRYLAVFLIVAMGLMSKPMLVTLPLLLLLLDYWPLNRFQPSQIIEQSNRYPVRSTTEIIGEKLPLLGLSLADGIATIFAQSDSRNVVTDLTYSAQLANVFHSYFWYVQKTFVPTGLMAFYPHAGQNVPRTTLAAGLFIGGLTAYWSLRCRRTKPYWLVAWAWFVISLLPVIGLIQVGAQAYADRYAYIPHIGLFIGLVWEVDSWIGTSKVARTAAAVIGIACLTACGLLTYQQAGHWKDAEALWAHALNVDPNNGRAHLLIAGPLMNRGEYEKAAYHIQEGIRLAREKPVAATYYNWALTLIAMRHDDDGEDKLRMAIKLEPEYTPALESLWQLLVRQQRQVDAEKVAQLINSAYIKNAKRNPHSVKWQLAAGQIELRRGNVRAAADYFERSTSLNPKEPLAYFQLGLALLQLGRRAEAKERLQKAVQLAPENANCHFKLGEVLESEGDIAGAIQEFLIACELEPTNTELQRRLDRLTKR